MGNKEFSEMCIKKVAQLLGYSEDELFIVWLCKILQNNKAVVSCIRPYPLYVECTYDGDTDELYINVYTKQLNTCIKEASHEGK